jgi:hypothetical protein
MPEILSRYLDIKEHTDKRFTWFWLGSYEKGLQNIKLEISKRSYPDHYEIMDFLGISVRTLDMATMFAHKLCAITDRRQLVNRDLYDAWWLLKQIAPIRDEIILERTGKNLTAYLSYLQAFIPKHIDKTSHCWGSWGVARSFPKRLGS